MSSTPTIEFLCDLARDASALVRAHQPSAAPLEGRGAVTEADLASEALVLERIRAAFPDHAILSEEHAKQAPAAAPFEGPLWVVDPLDGTTNYLEGRAHYAVSIAFGRAHAGRFEPLLAVVAQPATEALYAATSDGWHGAAPAPSTLPLRRRSLALQLGALGDPVTADLVGRLLSGGVRLGPIRILGAAALDLAHTALGRHGAYLARGLALWDVAAAALLVRAAGGTVTDLGGDPHLPLEGRQEVLAGDSATHAALLAALGR